MKSSIITIEMAKIPKRIDMYNCLYRLQFINFSILCFSAFLPNSGI